MTAKEVFQLAVFVSTITVFVSEYYHAKGRGFRDGYDKRVKEEEAGQIIPYISEPADLIPPPAKNVKPSPTPFHRRSQEGEVGLAKL